MAQSQQRPDWVDSTVTDRNTVEKLRAAGASDDFITVLLTECPEGVDRHSVRTETKKQLNGWGKHPTDLTIRAGGFFTALWNGRGYAGMADDPNQAILRKANLL